MMGFYLLATKGTWFVVLDIVVQLAPSSVSNNGHF